MASETPAVHVTGHCYCGGLTYQVTIPEGQDPFLAAYCHCDSCRRSHAAPLYQVVIVDKAMFEITSGADLLRGFKRPEGRITRAFCSACGTRIVNSFGEWTIRGRTPVAFFPNTLDEPITHAMPAPLRPTKNSFPQECVLESDRVRQMLDA